MRHGDNHAAQHVLLHGGGNANLIQRGQQLIRRRRQVVLGRKLGFSEDVAAGVAQKLQRIEVIIDGCQDAPDIRYLI